MSRRRKKLPQEAVIANVESLSHEGRGIARPNGKTVFIDGALPGETVSFKYIKQRARFDEGRVEEVITPASQRVEAKCAHYGVCGGCSLQHMDTASQIEFKQSVLLELFAKTGDLKPHELMEPLTGDHWGYRHKARLGVKYVHKKEKVLVGFRERRNSFIADITQCEVLHPSIGLKLTALQSLVADLSIYNQLPQIEVAVADTKTALIFRHLETMNDEDIQLLKNFEQEQDVDIYLQPGGIDTVARLNNQTSTPLFYDLDYQGLKIEFEPSDFTQINFGINRKMIKKVLQLLEPESTDNVLDLFCGLGNFTLPIAKTVAHVTGVECVAELVERAKFNAQKNNIDNAEFHADDLANLDESLAFLNKPFNKLVIDPPRSGAKEIIERMNLNTINRIVYISCNPSTLARDAEVLVKSKKFTLIKAGVVDMFPHTSHVESIAVFDQS